jgi:hypothetical protein
MNPEHPPPGDLERIQGWLSALIRHPGGTVAGLRAEEALDHLDTSPERLEEVVLRSPDLAAAERIDIYHRAYHGRLLECLKAEYPALLHALGQDLFAGFVRGYLHRHPPQSYTLARVGEHFCRWLAETRPDRDNPPERREDWPDFLIDLAAVERTMAEVEQGPGLEESRGPNADTLLGIPIETWPALRVQKAPCLRLLSLRASVHRYAQAVRAGQTPDLPSPAPAWLAVTRQDYGVRIHELAAAQHDLLDALFTGLPAGAAIERACGAAGGSFSEWMPRARTWLCLWADLGFFGGIGPLPSRADEAQTR